MKMKFSLRALVFWTHLAVGLTAGIVVFALALTGALLAFERPIVAASDARVFGKLTPTATTIPINQLIARTEQTAGQAVTTVAVPAGTTSAIALTVGRDQVYLANPDTGEIKGPASAGLRGFFEQLTGLHRWFGLSGASRKTVTVVKGWFTLGFVFLILSGWLLWLPVRWTPQALRVRMRPGWAQTARAREYNWHHSFGLWLSVPLLVVTATGVIMALPWANSLLFRATGSPVPVQQQERDGKGGSARDGERPQQSKQAAQQLGKQKDCHKQVSVIDYGQIIDAARAQADAWKTLQLRVPENGAHTAQVIADNGNGAQPEHRTTLVFRPSGQLDHVEQPTDQSPGRRARAYIRFLHTGEVYGFAGETIALLACLAAMILVYTGIALALRRFLR
ncbi:MAG: PepSY-associated TM helix domain-containing protein [Terracidiphilus sp.]|nr:PepSY-associated TM helix domain-containing protein [Terracidiphilus sp.]